MISPNHSPGAIQPGDDFSDEKGEVSEDRGFKALFTAYPLDTLTTLVPEVLAERGQPLTLEALQQESARPDLADPSRFHDLALLAKWADGSQVVIVLIEHWSEARKVDLNRVAWYVADLRLRHPAAAVYPVILVTESGAKPIADRMTMTVAGITTFDLRVKFIRVTPDDLPRLRQLQNRVAALLTILAVQDAVSGVVDALHQMSISPGPMDDLERFLPFAMKLGKFSEADAPRVRARLQEADMVNVITDMKNEARAAARAEGISQGKIAEIRRLVSKGLLTPDSARAEIGELIDAGAIPADLGNEALGLIG